MSNGITISRLFGKSPFAALQAHMIVVLECAREVQPLIEALARGDEARVMEAKDRIFEREAEADQIKNELRLHLPKSLFMPVDRRDLLEVAGHHREHGAGYCRTAGRAADEHT